MLKARVVYTSVSNGMPIKDREEEGDMSLDVLLGHITSIGELPSLSSYPGEAMGDRGFISIAAGRFILHAYFVDREEAVGNASVRFELFCSEQSVETLVGPWSGLIPVDGLKYVVRLIEECTSPVGYLKTNAVSLVEPSH
jgi:hypothetical protein